MIELPVLLRRLVAEAGTLRTFVGPGLEELGLTHDPEGEVALLDVGTIGEGGRCEIPLERATRVVAIARALPFVPAEPMGTRVDRLLMPLGVLDFEGRWRVREVAVGVSARDVQESCPFPLVAGADLIPFAER
ncbi:MAG: hypothetical protein AAGE52_17810 [Myxococcota bacterium]